MKKTVVSKLRCLLVVLLSLCAIFAFAACGDDDEKTTPGTTTPGTEQTEPGISPTSTVFVNGTSSDLVFTYTGELTAVKEGETALTAEQYTASEGQLTIKESYLGALARGEHTFTAVFGETNITFTVSCYAKPTITPATATFDWKYPADVEFTVDLGGASLVSVTFGGQPLEAAEYTLTGTTLSITEEAVEKYCAMGSNTFAFTTDVGSAVFYINTMTSEPTFGSANYKMQSANGEDVSFEFKSAGSTWKIEALTDGAYTEFAAENYTYEDDTLTIKASWLDAQFAGAYTFRITADEGTDDAKTFDFVAAAYGKTGSAHPIEATANAVNNFDQYKAGASVLGSNEDTDVLFKTIGAMDSVVEGAEAISGKSLKLESTPAGAAVDWNAMFNANLHFSTDANYYITMKVKVISTEKSGSTLVFRLDNPEQNILYLNHPNEDTYTPSSGTPIKPESSYTHSYDSATKVLTVSMFVTPSAGGTQRFRFMTANAGTAVIIIDDFTVLKTDRPLGNPSIGDATYVIEEEDDCDLAFTCPKGYTVQTVELNNTALDAAKYEIGAGKLTVKQAAFEELGVGTFDVKVTLGYISDEKGTSDTTAVTGHITLRSVADAKINGPQIQQQTSAKEALTWQVNKGRYTLNSVTVDGATVDAGQYETTDATFTLKKEYVDTLVVGAHEVALLYKVEGGDDITLKLTAVAYGNDTAHLAAGVGYAGFSDYEVGTTFDTIFGGKEEYFSTWEGTKSKLKVVSDTVFGKALQIPTDATSGSGMISFNKYELNKVYVLRLVFRVENDAVLSNMLIKWAIQGEDNVSWIENGKLKADTKDFRTSILYDEQTKVYTWTSYITKQTVEGAQLILWQPATRQALNIASIEFFETNLDEARGNADYTILSVAGSNAGASFVNHSTVTFSDDNTPLMIIGNMNDASGAYDTFKLMLGNKDLQLTTDYTAEGTHNHQNITLTAAFLKTIKTSVTITACRKNAADGTLGFDGQPFYQTCSVTVTRTAAD